MATTIVDGDVLAALRELLASRLTGDTYGDGEGDLLADFDATTRPTLTAATAAATRHARAAERTFPRATVEDNPALIDWAALTAAIRLDSALYPEQAASERSAVRVWQDELERLEGLLLPRIGPLDPDDPGGGGVDPETGAPASAVWAFGDGCCDLAPDAEIYKDPRRWRSGTWSCW
jgi:hypothetical protein